MVVQIFVVRVLVVRIVVVQVKAVQVVGVQVVEVVVGVEVPEEVETTPEVVAAILLITSAGIFNWPVLCSRS